MIVALAGCRTREEGAHQTGHAAREGAENRCPSDAQASLGNEACREAFCRSSCAPFEDSAQLIEVCLSQCRGEGTCASNADCRSGNVCVVIAPRLRRAGPRRRSFREPLPLHQRLTRDLREPKTKYESGQGRSMDWFTIAALLITIGAGIGLSLLV